MARKTETRQKLLDISLQLMMTHGYNATSIEEICKLAEVTKGGFFYYFKTKEMLGTEVIKHYWVTRKQQFAESDWMTADSPLEQIQAFLLVVADVFMTDPKGYSCLAGSFAQELATTTPMFQELVSSIFAEWGEQVKPILQSVIDSGTTQVDAAVLTDHMIVVIEGALILALARQDRNVIAQQMDMLNMNLRHLFG